MSKRLIGMEEAGRILFQKYRVQTVSFISTFCIGILIHLYVMTNKFFNYFEYRNIMADMSITQEDTLALGRWFLPAASNVLTGYSIPALNGIIVVFYLSLMAFMICELLQIKNMAKRIVFGCTLLSFPGVASTFSFGVNADAIVLAFLLPLAGVYITHRWKYGFLAGIVLIGCGIGIYQPGVAMAIGMIFAMLWFRAMDENFAIKEFVKDVAKHSLLLILGFVFYYGMLQLILNSMSVELSNYHGVDGMTSFTPKGIAKGLVYTYGYFLSYFFSAEYMEKWSRTAGHFIGAILFFAFLVFLYRKLKTNAKKWQTLTVTALLLALPLGLNAAPFLMADRVGNGVDIYMMFSMMLLWAVFLKMTESIKISPVMEWGALAAVLIVILNQTVICNQAYYRMDAMTSSTNSMMERMVARIEILPEWSKDTPVYFVNPGAIVNDNFEVTIPAFEQLKKLPGTELWTNYNELGYVQYCRVYLHFPVTVAKEEQKAALDRDDRVKNMPSYPAADSIQVIDGVIVVKVSDAED